MERMKLEIEKNIRTRIEEDKLDIKDKWKMDRTRVVQLSEILKRVSTDEMAHIKFGTNFGISVETISYVTKKIYFSAEHNVQKYLSTIEDNEEFLHLYLYYCFAGNLIGGHKNKMSSYLLREFCNKYPDIVKKYNINTHESEEEKELKQEKKK